MVWKISLKYYTDNLDLGCERSGTGKIIRPVDNDMAMLERRDVSDGSGRKKKVRCALACSGTLLMWTALWTRIAFGSRLRQFALFMISK